MLLSGLVARNQEVTWIVGTRDSCICGRLMKPNTQGFVQGQLLFVLCTSRSDSPGQAEPKARRRKALTIGIGVIIALGKPVYTAEDC